MDIDSLQVKISSDSTKANSAIDRLITNLGKLNSSLNNYSADSRYIKNLDNICNSFVKLSDSIAKIDDQKLKNLSGSIRSVGKSFSSLNDSVNSVNFTKIETAGKLMSERLEDSIQDVIKKFGLQGEAAERVSKSLKDYYSVYFTSSNSDSFFDKAVKSITDAEIVLHNFESTYDDVINYIKSTNSSGSKVYLPFNPSEFVDDYTSMRSTLGKAFTSDDSFKNTAQDIASYVSEMNSVIGTNIDVTKTEADIFRELVDVIRNARNQAVSFGSDVEKITISESDAEMAVANFIVTMEKFKNATNDSSSGMSQYKNSIEDVVENINKINSINIPDVSALDNISKSLGKLGGAKIERAITNMSNMQMPLQGFVNSLNGVQGITFDSSSLITMADSISKLGSKKVTQATANLPELSNHLAKFMNEINGIQKISFETGGLQELTKTIGVLGGKSVTNAITNLPLLTKALGDFIKELSTMPLVSQNIIDTVNAIGNLASQGQKVGSAMNGLSRSFGSSQRTLGGLSGMFNRTAKSGKSLAYVFGKMYANYFLLFRAFSKFKSSINIAADLTEVQNVVDNTFGDLSYKINEFSETSIKNFGMSELTAKKVAARFQSMGIAMGITNKQVQASNKSWSALSDIYNNSANSMADISINLTKLTADLASFYNIENYEEVGEKLESIFTGSTRPLRIFGLDLTQTTVKEWALTQGIEANFKTMTQAEKTMLRYQYVMAHTQNIQEDFIRTSSSWSNVMRMLSENFKNLGKVIGNISLNAFKPFLAALNTVILKLTELAKAVENSLGKIFGWKYEEGKGGGVSDLVDDVEDVADGFGSANDNAKKLKQTLAGFDELNIINDNKDNSASGSGTSGVGSAGANGGEWVKTEPMFKDYESNLDSLEKLGKAISDKLTDVMNKIDWDSIYEKARNFGKGLADFLNGLITPELFGAVGRTIASAINTALYAALGFAEEFDWSNFGTSLATGMSEFIKNWDAGLTAETLSTFAIGLLDSMTSAIKTFMTKETFKDVGQKVVDFICGIKWKDLNWKLAKFFSAFSEAIVKLPADFAAGIWKEVFKRIFKNFGIDESDIEIGLKKINFTEIIHSKVQKIVFKAFPEFNIPFKVANFIVEPGTIKEKLFKIFQIDDYLNTKYFKEVVSKTFENATKAFKEKDWASLGANIIGGIFEGFLNVFATIGEQIKIFFDKVVEEIKNVFGIHSPAEAMKPLGENILLGIVQGFTDKVSEFNTAIEKWFNESVKPWFTTDKWNEVYKSIKESLKAKWNETVKWWKENGPSAWIKNHVEQYFTRSKWDSILNGFKESFRSKFNDVIGFAESLANAVVNGMNRVVDALNSLSYDVPNWVPLVGGNHFGISLNHVSGVSLPRLANGAVIPPNQPFAAVLGDQTRGTNIEAPLDTIVKAFNVATAQNDTESNELLRQILRAVIEKETGIRKSELFESVRKSAREYQNATGRLAF